MPLTDRNQGNILKAQATRSQARYQLDAAILDLRAEVEQAVANLQAAEANARSVADEQIQLSTKVRDSIIEAYRLGGRPLIDVLDAQRNFRETNRLFIVSHATYWRSLYLFYAAIGKQVGNDE